MRAIDENGRASAFYLMLRAHDHIFGMFDIDHRLRDEAARLIWKCVIFAHQQSHNATTDTIPAVLIDGKRMIEVNP